MRARDWSGKADMSRWEYLHIQLNEAPPKSQDVQLLNGAGNSGWELVAITTNRIAYLKRQVDDPPHTTSTTVV
jgi:hypothetical protein